MSNVDSNWLRFLDYLMENSKATYISCNKDEVLRDDLDENIILELIYNDFFNGEEENNANKIMLLLVYGENLYYEGKTYKFSIKIQSPQISIRESIVDNNINKLLKRVLKRLEVYKETLDIGTRQASQMDSSTISWLYKLIDEFK